MGEKSTRKQGKTAPSKTMKEKRTAKADKKAAGSRAAETEAVTRVKNR